MHVHYPITVLGKPTNSSMTLKWFPHPLWANQNVRKCTLFNHSAWKPFKSSQGIYWEFGKSVYITILMRFFSLHERIMKNPVRNLFQLYAHRVLKRRRMITHKQHALSFFFGTSTSCAVSSMFWQSVHLLFKVTSSSSISFDISLSFDSFIISFPSLLRKLIFIWLSSFFPHSFC